MRWLRHLAILLEIVSADLNIWHVSLARENEAGVVGDRKLTYRTLFCFWL